MAAALDPSNVTDRHLRSRLVQWRTGWYRADATPPEPSADDLTYARALISDPCGYCGEAGGSIDHIDNTSHGWDNLTATCRSCNTAKGQHTLVRFMLARQLRIERERLNTQIRLLGESHGPRSIYVPAQRG